MDEVFTTLSRFGLRLRPAKCKLLKDKLTFLGHQLSAQGVTKDPEKVSAVREYKTPTSVQELRRFLGTCGFMRRYLRNFATIAKPLTDLLVGYSNKKKNRASNRKLEKQRWHWKGEHDKAFKQLKDAICEDVILKYPDFNQPFRIQTDASRTGLGAMLEQEEDGKWRPVAFASRRTSDTEKNYPTHKLEYLALKWAITEKFQDYVCAAPFTVYTDNAPLTYVWKSAKLDATGQRWLASLENFDFKVVYKYSPRRVKLDIFKKNSRMIASPLACVQLISFFLYERTTFSCRIQSKYTLNRINYGMFSTKISGSCITNLI